MSARNPGFLDHCILAPRRLALILGSVCLLLLAGTQSAWALYDVLYNGTIAYLATGANSTPGVTNPSGVAVDLLGDVYVADTGGNRIVEVSAAGVTAVLSISGLSPALNAPHQLTVDAAGNLYIADTGNNRIVKVDTSGNGTVVSTPSLTLSGPQGVAVDTSGDIYITDTGNNRVVKVTAGGTASVFATSSGVALTSLSSPKGIATDNYGNVYIVDTGNNRVVEVTTALVGSNITSAISSPSLSAPVSVSVGSNGNVYVVDGPDNDRIVLVRPQGGGYYDLLDDSNPEFNGVPSAVAQSANGSFYIADTENDDVDTFQINTAGFGHVTEGTSGTPLTLNFSIGLYTTLNSVSIYTTGTQTNDFTIAANSGSPCTNGTGGLVNCTVNVQFTPTAAGLRRGALVLSHTDQFPSTTTSNFVVPLFGYGDGPVAALSPGVASVVNAGTVSVGEPFQTAVDGAGNIYVTSYLNSTLLKIPAGGGAGTTVTIPALPSPTGLQNPTGLAIDGAGNLFIADYEHSRIVEVTPSGTSRVVTISGLSVGLSLPTALAFDGYGHLFVNDYGNGRIVVLTPDIINGDGTAGVADGYVYAIGGYTLGTDNSTGIAVDYSGNIYAPDESNNRVIEINPLGNESTVSLPGVGNLSGPLGVAVDPSGNLYVMDSGNARIIQKTTTGTVSVMKYSGPSLGQFIFGLAVDGGGNVLISDFVNNRLVLDNVGQSAWTFPNTKEGQTSTAQTTTVTNLGDQPLVFSANPAYTANFSENTSDTNLCTSDTSLTVSQTCDVSILFSPQSVGSLSANISVTDDTQNVASSTQQIAVSGTGLNPGDTTTTTQTNPALSSYSYGQPITISVHVADTTHTSTIPTGTVTFTDALTSTITPENLDSNGNATLLNNGVLNGIGTHSILAAYGGVSGSFLSSSTTISVAITQASTTVTGPGSALTLAAGQSGSATITITPQYSGTGVTMPSGSISYTIVNSSSATVSSGTATLTAGSTASTATVPIPNTLTPGSYTINVTYGGDTNYQSAAASPIALTVQQITPTITWSPSNSIAYGTSLSALLTATASSGGSSVAGTFAYTATASGGSPTPVGASTVLGAGTYTLQATFTPTNSGTYTTATSSVALTVGKVTPSVALTANNNPVILTGTVTFTAKASSSAGTPTGSVGFYDGTTLLSTVALAGGTAAYTTSSLAAGTHSVTAVYSGDSNFTSVTSTAVSELVQDFTISTPTSGSTSATVTPGGTATYTLDIGPSVGTVFPAPVTLSLSGLPPGATGTLSPTVLPAGSSLSSVTLTIQLPPQTARNNQKSSPMRSSPLILGLLILPFAQKLRRTGKRLSGKLTFLLMLIAGTAGFTAMTGCSSSNGFFAQQQQSYTITITATSGTLSHSTNVTLTVE